MVASSPAQAPTPTAQATPPKVRTKPLAFEQKADRTPTEAWTGVRNHAAKQNLIKMKKGDRALLYHSGDDKAAAPRCNHAYTVRLTPCRNSLW